MEFLIKRSKLIHILYGVLCFILLISAVAFMTQYSNIRVLTTLSSNGVVDLQTSDINKFFIDFYTANGLGDAKPDMWKIYNFQQSLNDFNNIILYFGVAALVLFAVLMIAGNQSRKVYYLSNLVTGVAVPSVIAVLSIVLISLNSGFYGKFNEGYDIYNRASLLIEEKDGSVNSQLSIEELTKLYNCDTTTFTIYNLLFILILIASLAMVGYAIYRYISSTEKRNQIIARAVSENE